MKWQSSGREVRNAIQESIAFAASDEEAKVICASHNLVVDDLMSRFLLKTEPNGAICQRCNDALTCCMYYTPSRYEAVCDNCLTIEEVRVEALRKGLG